MGSDNISLFVGNAEILLRIFFRDPGMPGAVTVGFDRIDAFIQYAVLVIVVQQRSPGQLLLIDVPSQLVGKVKPSTFVFF